MSEACAVVFLSAGGAQGCLGLIRSLGRSGVRVVLVSADPGTALRYSRYVERTISVQSFTDGRDEVLESLQRLANDEDKPLVLFPTADPDLSFLSSSRDVLGDAYKTTFPSENIVDVFLDKGKFFHFGRDHGFPIAGTVIPRSPSDLAAVSNEFSFPLIVKPLDPRAWRHPEIRRLVQWKKAVLVHDQRELEDWYSAIAKFDGKMVVQQYVPGRDDNLYSVHAYVSRSGEPAAFFVGRKVRTAPAYAGIGCYVISDYRSDLVETSRKILESCDYRGIGLLQYKQDESTGEFVLLEINPRTSSWNHLATRCGINIPLLAYRDALSGTIDQVPPQRNGLKYFFFGPDRRSVRAYMRGGDLTVSSWLRSYRGPRTYQMLCADDPLPLIGTVLRRWASVPRRAVRAAGRLTSR